MFSLSLCHFNERMGPSMIYVAPQDHKFFPVEDIATWMDIDKTGFFIHNYRNISSANLITSFFVKGTTTGGTTFITPNTTTTSYSITIPLASGTLALLSNIPSSFTLTDDILDGSSNKYSPYTSAANGVLYTLSTPAIPTNTANSLHYGGKFYASYFEGIIDCGTWS